MIDSDGGIDDTTALWWAATQPDVTIVAVTAVWGNVEVHQAAINLQRVLHLNGMSSVPVGVGGPGAWREAPKLLRADFIHGADGMGNTARAPAPLPPPTARAVDVLRRVVDERPGEIVVVTLGPLSNIAATLEADPSWAARVKRLVVMGGAVAVQGNAMPVGEANVAHDPHAAAAAFAAAWAHPPLMVGLDVTLQATLCTADIELARRGLTPAAADLADMLAFYQPFGGTFNDHGHFPSHDTLAVMAAVHPAIVSGPVLPVAVAADKGPAQGMTVVDRRQPYFARNGKHQTMPEGFHACHVALSVDVARFRSEMRAMFGDTHRAHSRQEEAAK